MTVGPVSSCLEAHGGDESECVEHHAHYMWVPMFTLAQAAISFLPHYLWFYWEGEDYSYNRLPGGKRGKGNIFIYLGDPVCIKLINKIS